MHGMNGSNEKGKNMQKGMQMEGALGSMDGGNWKEIRTILFCVTVISCCRSNSESSGLAL